MMFSKQKKTEEREQILSSGEKIRIRQLSPAERLKCLALPGDDGFCKRLSLGLIRPEISFRNAKKMLNTNPFQALEIVRAIQLFSKELDLSNRNMQYQKQDELFLNALHNIENLKRHS